MDDSYKLSTPEQIELAYDVAGLGSRFIAALIDGLLQFSVIIAIWVIAIFGYALTGLSRVDRLTTSQALSVGSVVLAAGIVAMFVVIWGYYIFFEMVWNGQTPGKRLSGIRVLATGGQPISLPQVMVRNLVRIVDFLPWSYMLGAMVMLLNRRSQRLGDLAAGTIVIKEKHQTPPRTLPTFPGSESALEPAGTFSAEEIALAREFLLRRDELPRDRRAELAEQLAVGLRDRLDPGMVPDSPEALLERVAQSRS